MLLKNIFFRSFSFRNTFVLEFALKFGENSIIVWNQVSQVFFISESCRKGIWKRVIGTHFASSSNINLMFWIILKV